MDNNVFVFSTAVYAKVVYDAIMATWHFSDGVITLDDCTLTVNDENSITEITTVITTYFFEWLVR